MNTRPHPFGLVLAILAACAIATGATVVGGAPTAPLFDSSDRALAQGRPQRADRGDRTAGAESVSIAGLRASVWRPRTRGRAPLVIFSHGFHGSSLQSTFLMTALAADGYLVI